MTILYRRSRDEMPAIEREIEEAIEEIEKNGIPDILTIYLADNVKARRLQADGTYEWLTPGDLPPVDSQRWLLEHRAQG